MFADIHAHILPGIDDGPKDMQQSVELARLALQDGIDQIVATPHFYASRHSLQERTAFGAMRLKHFQKVIADANLPLHLKLGYEVLYFSGISHSEEIDRLCLNGSRVLLLELGGEPISDKIIEDILELDYRGYTVLLAHIERYAKLKGYKKLTQLVKERRVLSQVNAESFLIGPFSRAAIHLLKENLVTLLASDMHSVEYRSPRLKEAYRWIENRFGTRTSERLIYRSEELFSLIDQTGG